MIKLGDGNMIATRFIQVGVALIFGALLIKVALNNNRLALTMGAIGFVAVAIGFLIAPFTH